ncbi:MAG: GNAT family N-acetyltransferase [Proteobacteria bacterium]|nr:MAG: GNAT family N-acetyltransferase [Pseudomonadota bacterium]
MLRKGSPIYGRSFLHSLLTELPGAEVATLWLGNEAVSGAITVTYKGVTIVPFVSSREKFFPLRPNNLLYWEIMKRSGAQGGKFLDFGTSLKGASTLEFKKSWGSSLVELPSYVFSPANETIQLDGGQGSVQLGVKIWKKLPPPVAEWLGPKIARLML